MAGPALHVVVLTASGCDLSRWSDPEELRRFAAELWRSIGGPGGRDPVVVRFEQDGGLARAAVVQLGLDMSLALHVDDAGHACAAVLSWSPVDADEAAAAMRDFFEVEVAGQTMHRPFNPLNAVRL